MSIAGRMDARQSSSPDVTFRESPQFQCRKPCIETLVAQHVNPIGMLDRTRSSMADFCISAAPSPQLRRQHTIPIRLATARKFLCGKGRVSRGSIGL